MNWKVLLASGAIAGVAFARDVPVSTVSQLQTAISNAQPGDVILLADGTYAITSKLSCSRPGSASMPIVVKAMNPLGAVLESNTVIAFGVSAPFWRFEDFTIRGVCASDDTCEHAFQVTGAATDTVLRHLRMVDFNAQLKVNASPAGDGGSTCRTAGSSSAVRSMTRDHATRETR